MLAFQDLLKAPDGFFQRHVLPGHPRKLLRHIERLGQEPLQLPCTGYRQLILLRQLLHPQDRDDVLQVLIFLQHLLHLPGGLVMLLPQD